MALVLYLIIALPLVAVTRREPLLPCLPLNQ